MMHLHWDYHAVETLTDRRVITIIACTMALSVDNVKLRAEDVLAPD